MRVLVLNAGSSSLKASLLDVGSVEPLAELSVGWGSDAARASERRAAVAAVVGQLTRRGADEPPLVGHRIVHGGSQYAESVVLDDVVLAELDGLAELAPLHNPIAVGTARAAIELLPGATHVAVFDTAFHATLPQAEAVYALPWRWYAEWSVRRYGFHGLSVAWSTRRAAQLLDRPAADLRLVVAHLGSGCSVTAVDGGRSVATSMGMTPLEGLMMGTRAGSFDPGITLRLLREQRLAPGELADALEHDAGLLGVSGVSGDLREVQQAADAGDPRAELALEIFVRRAAQGVAAAATALPRVDAVVFTGGIGEHAGRVRARIVERLAVVGVSPIGQDETGEDRRLSSPGAKPAVVRVSAREDVVIAEEVRAAVG